MSTHLTSFYHATIEPLVKNACGAIESLDHPCKPMDQFIDYVDDKTNKLFPKIVCDLTKDILKSSHYIAFGILLPTPLYIAIMISIISYKLLHNKENSIYTLINGVTVTSIMNSCKHIIHWNFSSFLINIISTITLFTFSKLYKDLKNKNKTIPANTGTYVPTN